MACQLRRLATSIIALVFLAGPAMAQLPDAKEIERRYAALDSDRDGRISHNEFELNKVLALLNRRGRAGAASGAIDRQTAVTRAQSGLATGAFNALDTNSDGVLTGAEFIASDQMRFESIDRNADGFIDRNEFNALVNSLFR
jgi:Ca2+-binding EF-hand superfamily protein